MKRLRRLILLLPALVCLVCPLHLAFFGGLIGLTVAHEKHEESIWVYIIGVISFVVFIILEWRHHKKHKCDHAGH